MLKAKRSINEIMTMGNLQQFLIQNTIAISAGLLIGAAFATFGSM